MALIRVRRCGFVDEQIGARPAVERRGRRDMLFIPIMILPVHLHTVNSDRSVGVSVSGVPYAAERFRAGVVDRVIRME